MTQYIVTYEKINTRLETETWHDQRPSHRKVDELVVKAEKVMQHYVAQIDAAYLQAEREGTNVWDALLAIPSTRAIEAYEDIRQKLNGAKHCECAPDGSHTCRLCQNEAWVRYQYANLFEEDK